MHLSPPAAIHFVFSQKTEQHNIHMQAHICNRLSPPTHTHQLHYITVIKNFQPGAGNRQHIHVYICISQEYGDNFCSYLKYFGAIQTHTHTHIYIMIASNVFHIT